MTTPEPEKLGGPKLTREKFLKFGAAGLASAAAASKGVQLIGKIGTGDELPSSAELGHTIDMEQVPGNIQRAIPELLDFLPDDVPISIRYTLDDDTTTVGSQFGTNTVTYGSGKVFEYVKGGDETDLKEFLEINPNDFVKIELFTVKRFPMQVGFEAMQWETREAKYQLHKGRVEEMGLNIRFEFPSRALHDPELRVRDEFGIYLRSPIIDPLKFPNDLRITKEMKGEDQEDHDYENVSDQPGYDRQVESETVSAQLDVRIADITHGEGELHEGDRYKVYRYPELIADFQPDQEYFGFPSNRADKILKHVLSDRELFKVFKTLMGNTPEIQDLVKA